MLDLTSSASRQRGGLRARIAIVIGLGSVLAMTAGCSWLYVGSTAPAIETFRVGGSGQLIRTSSTTSLTTTGAPSAMKAVGKFLYVASGSGVVAQFAIDPMSGALTSIGTIPAGSPPYSMAATSKNVYVGNYGSGNVSVYSINASGGLASVQTVNVAGIRSVQVDTAGKFLFTGNRASGGVGPQVCTHVIQLNGSLSAPSCVSVNGAPQAMQFSGGVLFLLFNAAVPPTPGVGVTNWVSAWSVNPTTGALTHSGTDLDIGAANTGGMGVSVNGQTLFIPRQGGFTTVGTAIPLGYSMYTFAPTMSQWCLLPPAGPGEVLVDPTGQALYITDPIGGTTGNIIGPRVTSLAISAGGALTPATCETTAVLPNSMAIFAP
jgi:lactonase family protein with 7-bladed beta-propeller